MSENWENTIIDYFNGMLSLEEEEAMFIEMDSNPELKKLYDQYKEIELRIEKEELQQPSLELSHRFSQMLEMEIKDQKQEFPYPYKILAYAASIVALVTLGIMIGQNQFQSGLLDAQSKEIVGLRSEMNALINDQSVTNRIEAINVAYEFPEQDDKVIDLLIKTMESDPSSNVRLAAVEALVEIPITNATKKAIYERLEVEEDSFVKIALIQAVVKINDKNSVHLLDKITQDEMTPKFIKDEAHIAQLKLNKT
jgi:hypothetical protein